MNWVWTLLFEVAEVIEKLATSKLPEGGLSLSAGDSPKTMTIWPVELAWLMEVFSITVLSLLVVLISLASLIWLRLKSASSLTKPMGSLPELTIMRKVLLGGRVVEEGLKVTLAVDTWALEKSEIPNFKSENVRGRAIRMRIRIMDWVEYLER